MEKEINRLKLESYDLIMRKTMIERELRPIMARLQQNLIKLGELEKKDGSGKKIK